ncbi:TPA: TonB-dependent siderophore receptor [Burkholderia contaminans]|uniref:TonB-dependent siderophore receptor n=1 Tax=Burkholderia contaminans TaxID=488447 RepID=A0AAP4QXK2_9BURK|nr:MULTISPECIES: TonB-dependent siderophore receptor [Burkholderia]MBD1410095.1 TonB-dependent siderophore receptor [Burkholderia contaminans]MBH9668434.1 TonB-dependent siderophore receptor [Burkholderia contaminans]MBH9675284.1 TonB-dependent siderophore receptor [Burkholderia contaminans]MBH9705707.1 TonB-dependent siderophore receptor [Burkholderia contaminans]MBM6425411.1 TonB-dependent siderophore receptor [Burkholderia contaminans]
MVTGTGAARRARAVAAGSAWVMAAAGGAHAQATGAATTPPAGAAAAVLPAIDVTGKGNRASSGLVGLRTTAGTKTDTPVAEIPQTINLVTAQQIEMTGATDLNQALRYVPGFATFGADSRTDWYAALRGFTPTLYVDGVAAPNTAVIANWRVDPYTIDSIAVLRGPTSVLYGAGEPGAIVDAHTKLADGERVREAGVQLGNDARKQFMLDVGDALDPDGRYAYRFVGVARDGNAVTGPNGDRRVALAPSFRWRPNADTSLTLSATFLQDSSDISSNFLPASGTVLPNPNGRLSQDIYMGTPGFNDYRKKQWSLGYALEHRVNAIWSLHQDVRWSHLSLDDATVFGIGFVPRSTTTMMRYAGLFQLNYSRFDIDNHAQARFGTGPLEHTLLLGAQYDRQTTTNSVWLALAPSLNLYHPVYRPVTDAIFSGPTSLGHVDQYTAMNVFGVYAQDQIRWKRWTLTLGGREDFVNARFDNRTAGTQAQQDVSAFSGRVGLTYQGDAGLSPYVSYSTSFDPVIGVRMYGGGMPKPTRGKQTEAGLRWQPPGRNLLLSAAVYQIDQTNVATPTPVSLDPTGTTSVQTGKVRSRGIELSAVGKVTRELSVVASYVYQDVKNVQANDASLNNWPVAVPLPRQMASMWADWTWRTDALSGLGIGGGVRYQSASAGAPDNSLTVPSVTLYDLALHYEMPHWRFALNVANLFDRRYVSGCTSYTVCVFGNERTVLATAKYNW